MLPAFEKVMLVVQPIALAVLLIYVYGLFCRSLKNPYVLKTVMGGMFGFAAAVAMSAPIPLADGVIVDIRNLFIGIAAAFFGVIGGGIALLTGASMRISIGGDGVALGIGGMMIACMMGGLWGYMLRQRIKHELWGLVLLALMISQHMVVALYLPTTLRDSFIFGLGPTLLAANLIGTIMLGTLIVRERALADENQRLVSEATTDPLTKLMNRNSAAIAFQILRGPKDPAKGTAMLCIDVDNFKAVNDTHGHLTGDAVLVEIADRLTSCLRPHDVISRISGDEFLIVLSDLAPTQAHAVAERCRNAISSTPIHFKGTAMDTSISIGAVWTREQLTFNAFREKSDEALYRAKADGRDAVKFERHEVDEPDIQAAVA